MGNIVTLRFASPLLVVFALAGCGTTSIGRGPTDLDLTNDGTPEAQRALQSKYTLAYANGRVTRPGAAPDVVAAEINTRVAEVRAPAYADEVADYLATSSSAEEVTDTAAIGFDRFAHSSTPTTMIFATSVIAGAGVGVASAVDAGRIDAGTLSAMTWGALNGALAGVILSIPLNIIYLWTVPLVSSAIAAPDYRRGVRTFNADLGARIARGAAPVAPPAPPASASPLPAEAEAAPPPAAVPAPPPDAPSDPGDAPPPPSVP